MKKKKYEMPVTSIMEVYLENMLAESESLEWFTDEEDLIEYSEEIL